MNELTILPTECDCERCSLMCMAPCCGTPEDMMTLMDKGYGSRLMLDDWPDYNGNPNLIKPAMKGSEGCKAPWETRTAEGCTFWKDGKCELHSIGLKPTQGKLALHGQNEDETYYIADIIRASWKTDEAKACIDRFNKEFYETDA